MQVSIFLYDDNYEVLHWVMAFVFIYVDSILYSGVYYRFNENFDGVILAYDFNILDKNAKILNGIHPYFGVRLKAKLLLFSPKPDMLLGKLSVTL